MKIRNHLKCDDGFTMSIQASEYHYCLPRDNEGPYTHVEIGFPSEVEPLLLPYADEPEEPTQTVYGYVPREVVEAVVRKHSHGAVLIGMDFNPRYEINHKNGKPEDNRIENLTIQRSKQP